VVIMAFILTASFGGSVLRPLVRELDLLLYDLELRYHCCQRDRFVRCGNKGAKANKLRSYS
jgi:hypothetical protein